MQYGEIYNFPSEAFEKALDDEELSAEEEEEVQNPIQVWKFMVCIPHRLLCSSDLYTKHKFPLPLNVMLHTMQQNFPLPPSLPLFPTPFLSLSPSLPLFPPPSHPSFSLPPQEEESAPEFVAEDEIEESDLSDLEDWGRLEDWEEGEGESESSEEEREPVVLGKKRRTVEIEYETEMEPRAKLKA